MVQFTFIQPDGTRNTVYATPGMSVMETAQHNGIGGIIAECGGSMACATCHAYFDADTIAKIGASEGNEHEMLDFAATPRSEHSRLSCQVEVSEVLEGAEITIPDSQV
ncbi:ferredoxin, 2Fe-2S [Salinihabitans flavidus]|uniref:Ferredoxin, 2Fe-2S n=1 Tax=Salinihabitans flavidus TaxID=569882 RepID=A0A1H8RJX7_9RHOB|nr:2Fe-2S iron-sulfur cluster-binding protein [Salinihabitans flavidus]SEO66632.1 ferredoxin, 2Fe-2S [Salinihabitans flavidus]